jgi:hypothetical protein
LAQSKKSLLSDMVHVRIGKKNCYVGSETSLASVKGTEPQGTVPVIIFLGGEGINRSDMRPGE